MSIRSIRRARQRRLMLAGSAAAALVLLANPSSAQSGSPGQPDGGSPSASELDTVQAAVEAAGAQEPTAALSLATANSATSSDSTSLSVSHVDQSVIVEALAAGDQPVTITALDVGTDAEAITIQEGAAVVEGDGTTVVERVTNGFRLTRTVMSAADGATTRYEVDLPAEWTMSISPSGQVLIIDGSHFVTGVIDAPWAVTAQGDLLPTRFTVDENLLIQHVEMPTATAAYPVVIDPTYKDMSNGIPHTRNGSARNYMRGHIRPEKDFASARGYYPRWGRNGDVLRAVRQGGECSWAPDTGAFYDFQVPCKSHDYCYDLRRVSGYTSVTKQGCDDEFKVAMYQDCNSRGEPAKTLCKGTAESFYAAVQSAGRGGPRSIGDDLTNGVGDGPDDGLYPPVPVGPWDED